MNPAPSTGVDPASAVAFRAARARRAPRAAKRASTARRRARHAEAHVELFDLRGARVRVLQAARLPAGRHELQWDGRDGGGTPQSPGVYFIRARAGRGATALVSARDGRGGEVLDACSAQRAVGDPDGGSARPKHSDGAPDHGLRATAGGVSYEGGWAAAMTDNAHWLATGNLVLGGLVFLLGLVILRENPGQRLNRVVSLLLFFGGFGAVLSALALLAPAGSAGATLPETAAYLWELFFPTAFLLASIFPEERAFTRRIELPGGLRTPSFMLVVFAPHVFHFVLMLLMGMWKPETDPVLSVPETVRPLFAGFAVIARVWLGVHRSLFSLVDLGFGAGAIALLLGAWRRTQVPRIRAQIGAIAVGLAGCLVLYASSTSVPTLLGRQMPRQLQTLLTTAALLLGSGAIAYAMVRYKFLDAKLIARRGILYALASAVLIGIYLLVVERVNRFVAASFGLDARVIEPVFLIMALTLFQPAIARLEESLDQMFLRDPGDYRNVLRALGRELQTTIDLDDLLTRAARTMTEALLLRSSYVLALTREGPVSRSGAGDPLDEAAIAGLGETLGGSNRGCRCSGWPTRSTGCAARIASCSWTASAASCCCRCAGAARCSGSCCSARSSRAPSTRPRTRRCCRRSRRRCPCRCRTRCCCATACRWRASKRSCTWRSRSSARSCARSSR
ncbi:MAG: hypothetical protein IPJ04_13905 [Candidatus Eisenbacteria bacterium]|nr:hypothetical protein [Candidatus Eisenbacteria bacterium]